MTVPVSIRYAWRSLARHRRRTALSMVGIGVGCAVCLFLVSFIRGEGRMIMRAAAESGNGHLRITTPEWLETRTQSARLPDWERLLSWVRSLPDVAAAGPHVRIDALLAMGTRTAACVMEGVDPEAEPRLNRLVRFVSEGAYLKPGARGRIVIGQGLARRLRLGPGDDLMVTVSDATGEMRGAMLQVCGIVRTGSEHLDQTICQAALDDVERLWGRPGASEVCILLHERAVDRLPEVAARIRKRLPPGAVVATWDQVLPELAAGMRVDRTWTHLIVGIVVAVTFLGIAGAQLAAVLERRKEFAVLLALGMRGRRLAGVLLAESIMLAGAGGGAGLILGLPAVSALCAWGIDFSAFYQNGDLAVSNVLLDPVIYGEFGWWVFPLAFGLAFGAALASSLYAVRHALRIDPVEALRTAEWA